MTRTKGAKDRKPRRITPAMEEVLFHKKKDGCRSFRIRIYGPSNGVKWFADMSTEERGALLATAKEKFVQLANGNWVVKDL